MHTADMSPHYSQNYVSHTFGVVKLPYRLPKCHDVGSKLYSIFRLLESRRNHSSYSGVFQSGGASHHGECNTTQQIQSFHRLAKYKAVQNWPLFTRESKLILSWLYRLSSIPSQGITSILGSPW